MVSLLWVGLLGSRGEVMALYEVDLTVRVSTYANDSGEAIENAHVALRSNSLIAAMERREVTGVREIPTMTTEVPA